MSEPSYGHAPCPHCGNGVIVEITEHEFQLKTMSAEVAASMTPEQRALDRDLAAELMADQLNDTNPLLERLGRN